jgi:hypothetical protein
VVVLEEVEVEVVLEQQEVADNKVLCIVWERAGAGEAGT